MLEEAKSDLPPNFKIIYSMGSRQDQSDLLCVLLPTTRVGIPQNNIKHFKKRLGERTFSQAQEERTRKK